MSGNTRGLQVQIKHVFDRLASLVLLVLVSPLLLFLAIAIVLDDGWPILFCQQRLGRFGRLFTMYKFRSMTLGCTQVLNDDGSTRVDTNDLRVTRVGGVLRRTSLDELPQLLNVLVGQMSLVGPRPDLPEHMALYTESERRKLRMKPGITGLPQVTGRNDLSWKERIRLDNKYIDNYSLWWDVKILYYTVSAVWTGRGVTASGGRNHE